MTLNPKPHLLVPLADALAFQKRKNVFVFAQKVPCREDVAKLDGRRPQLRTHIGHYVLHGKALRDAQRPCFDTTGALKRRSSRENTCIPNIAISSRRGRSSSITNAKSGKDKGGLGRWSMKASRIRKRQRVTLQARSEDSNAVPKRHLHNIDGGVADRPRPEVLKEVPGLKPSKLGVRVLVAPD